MVYRVKQFINGLTAKLSKEDFLFINKYLKDIEKELFFQLRVSEQYHSVMVANGCRGEAPENANLIRAALLHDIGKIGTNLTLVNKSFVVLTKKAKLDKKYLPRFLQKAINYQLSHPQRGYDLLKKLNTNDHILDIVLNHHNDSEDDKDIKLVQKYDNLY